MAKVTTKYQITIPMKVRKELCIVPGSEVDISKEGERYILVVDPIEAVKKKWRGTFRDRSTTMEYLEEIRCSVQ